MRGEYFTLKPATTYIVYSTKNMHFRLLGAPFYFIFFPSSIQTHIQYIVFNLGRPLLISRTN